MQCCTVVLQNLEYTHTYLNQICTKNTLYICCISGIRCRCVFTNVDPYHSLLPGNKNPFCPLVFPSCHHRHHRGLGDHVGFWARDDFCLLPGFYRRVLSLKTCQNMGPGLVQPSLPMTHSHQDPWRSHHPDHLGGYYGLGRNHPGHLGHPAVHHCQYHGCPVHLTMKSICQKSFNFLILSTIP